MRLADLINVQLLVVPAPWRTLEDTVRGLVMRLHERGRLPAAAIETAVAAVLAREADESTAALEIGVGLPHARVVGVEAPSLAIAAATSPLYEPVPTVSIDIVALVLSPPEAVQQHLQMLAWLGTVLQSRDLRQALRRAPDPAAALAALERHERATVP